MAVAPLPNLPDRTFVCIDANIFVYALTASLCNAGNSSNDASGKK